MKRLLYTYFILMSMDSLVYSIRCPACTKPENDQRVCGTDGRTYASICYLGRRVCKGDSPDLVVAHSGKCQQNTNIITSTSIPLQTERPTTVAIQTVPPDPTYQNGGGCSLSLEPVCGSDGITYPSPCFLERFATLPEKRNLIVARMGFCEPCNVPQDASKNSDNEPEITTNAPTSEPEPQAESEPDVTTTSDPTALETTMEPVATRRPRPTRKRKPKPVRRRKNQQSRKTTTTLQPTPENLAPNFGGGIDFGGGSDLWTKPIQNPEPTVKSEPSVATSEKSPESESSFGVGIDPNPGFGGSDQWFKPKPDPGPLATTMAPTTPATGIYYGKRIGSLELAGSRRASHGIQGTVYAIDQSTIRIVNFTYDGNAPDAFFWAGSTNEPDDTGEIIPDENGRKRKLRSYENQDIILSLPKGRTLADYTWVSVWCRRFYENFAEVYIATDFVVPAEHDLGVLGFKPRVHNVRSPAVVIVDTKTIRLHSLTYDGTAPDAYFWIGSGSPDATGRSVPYINGSINGFLPKFRRDTVTVQLPDDVTVFDIDYISVWSNILQQDFGHVIIPNRRILNIPPFIEVMVEKPTSRPTDMAVEEVSSMSTEPPVRNSEDLSKNYQVSWLIDGDEIEIKLTARLQTRHYMAFGISGSRIRSAMFGSDVAVAWMDGDTPMVDDYYLGGYSQCSGGSGACKDESFILPGVNDYKAVTGSTVDGATSISYRRKLNTGDALDMTISLTESMYIVWAIGPIDDDGLVNKHINIGGDTFSFGRDPVNNAQPMFMSDQTETENVPTWPEIEIIGKDITTFDAKIGPTGGHARYAAMTGNTDWGFAWYLNEKLAPKLILKRGVEYTFRVFGGDDESLIAEYHPFYITDDVTGGNPSSNMFKYQTIYAGPAVGGYCEYSNKRKDRSKQSATFEDYFKTLKEKCNRRILPGILTWTPDATTPDTVYYQCYTHQYFGWKIEIVDNFL